MNQIESVRDSVARSNGGFADFPLLNSLTIETLRSEGYSIRPNRTVFIGGWRVYSPAFCQEPPIIIPQEPSAPSWGDVEGAILSRQSILLSTL